MTIWICRDGDFCVYVHRISAYRGIWYLVHLSTSELLEHQEVFIHYAAYMGPHREDCAAWLDMFANAMERRSL